MKTKTNLLLVVVWSLFFSGFTYAKDDAVYDCREDVVFAHQHGIGLILDVFVPKGKKNGFGIIHTMNGGYYSHNEMREHFRNNFKIYDKFCSRGYIVFSIRPGSCTKFTIEEMTANLKTGIRWVKEHAVEYKVDPNRLGLTGASAGGNLALLTMVHEETGDPNEQYPLKRHSTRIYTAGILYPPTDWLDENDKLSSQSREWLEKLAFSCGFEDCSEEEIIAKAKALSPARQVKTALPPVVLFHGDKDESVPIEHSKKMVDAILKAGGQAKLVTMKGYGHDWPSMYINQLVDWFDKQLIRK